MLRHEWVVRLAYPDVSLGRLRGAYLALALLHRLHLLGHLHHVGLHRHHLHHHLLLPLHAGHAHTHAEALLLLLRSVGLVRVSTASPDVHAVAAHRRLAPGTQSVGEVATLSTHAGTGRRRCRRAEWSIGEPPALVLTLSLTLGTLHRGGEHSGSSTGRGLGGLGGSGRRSRWLGGRSVDGGSRRALIQHRLVPREQPVEERGIEVCSDD